MHMRNSGALLEWPGLIVLDEWLTPCTEDLKAMSEIRTVKRILLSGTILKNNFRELYNTMHLVTLDFAKMFSAIYEQMLIQRLLAKEKIMGKGSGPD